MKKIYLTNVIGAPSPTVVIVSEEDIVRINWQQIAFETYYFLKAKKVVFSKMAIIHSKSENVYDFKFVQIKKRNNGIELESNANCGNSMIASARIVYMFKEKQQKVQNSISLINIDTKLEMSIQRRENCFDLSIDSLVGRTINSAKMFEGSEVINIHESFGNIKASIIDIVNPYIIIDAKSFGITTYTELLELDDTDTEIMGKVKKVRKDIIQRYNFNENSEFPKVAIVLNDNVLTARTIYLNSWHKGLPITAAISIALAGKIKNSVIYRQDLERDDILTPKGSKKVTIITDKNGTILRCEVFGIKSEGEIDIYIYDDKK